MPKTPMRVSHSATSLKAQPADTTDEDYLRSRRVNAMHQKFMREVVVPSRKENT